MDRPYDQDLDPANPAEVITIYYYPSTHTFFAALALLLAIFALACAMVALNTVPVKGPRGQQGPPGIEGKPGPRGPQGNPGVSRFP